MRYNDECAGLSACAALKNLGGNEALYAKLLSRFAEEYANVPGQIADALAAGDQRTAVRLAHTVKGVAANLGALHLASTAGDLENALAANGEYAVLLARMRDALRQTLESIRSRIAATPKPDGPLVRREMNAEQRAALIAVLQEVPGRIRSDWLSLQEPLKSYESLLAHPATSAAYAALMRAVDDFDADAARVQVETLLAILQRTPRSPEA